MYYESFCEQNICKSDSLCLSLLISDSYIKLGARTPSEKDFCGTQCLTPDCEGLILKVQIYDSMDYMTRTVEDRKLKEKLGKEASVKKIEKKKRI